MIFPKNGGSVDAIDHFWGKCSSKVILFGGVEIMLVAFWGSVVPFYENLGGVKTFHQKSSRMGGGRYLFQKTGGGRSYVRSLSKEMGKLTHQIGRLQSLKWGTAVSASPVYSIFPS